jgi:hypothetical protein
MEDSSAALAEVVPPNTKHVNARTLDQTKHFIGSPPPWAIQSDTPNASLAKTNG